MWGKEQEEGKPAATKTTEGPTCNCWDSFPTQWKGRSGTMVRCLRNGKPLPKGEKRHHRYHGYLAFLVELPQHEEARKVTK